MNNILKEDNKIYWIDSNNRKIEIKEHEYLCEEDYYESRSVGTKARSNKTCEFCGETIIKGIPHKLHHFYPEFKSYPTHIDCEKPFKISLIPLMIE